MCIATLWPTVPPGFSALPFFYSIGIVAAYAIAWLYLRWKRKSANLKANGERMGRSYLPDIILLSLVISGLLTFLVLYPGAEGIDFYGESPAFVWQLFLATFGAVVLLIRWIFKMNEEP